jgi:hypothetical protein
MAENNGHLASIVARCMIWSFPLRKAHKDMTQGIFQGGEKVKNIGEFSFEIGQEFFDGIGVWGVGRQINQNTAGGPDGFSCSLELVECCVVHDHHLPRLQSRDGSLLHPGAEDFPIGGVVVDAFGDGFTVYVAGNDVPSTEFPASHGAKYLFHLC